MKIISSVKKMQQFSRRCRFNAKTIALIPTMGALHEGHLSLIRRARKENDIVVVSIFVNPTQFGAREDFSKYPRDLKLDIRLCKSFGADIIFHPSIKQVYPDGHRTEVEVRGLSDKLCGRYRPGHFKGVATIVLKLFNIVGPDLAYFGQKDAQQCIVIKQMIKDLNLPVRIKIVPTVREKDGLAMSSRNTYLSAQERKDAVILYQSLRSAKILIKQKAEEPADVIRIIKQMIARRKSAKVQYVAIVDAENLEPKDDLKGKILIAIAVWIGKTRLIDNLIVNK